MNTTLLTAVGDVLPEDTVARIALAAAGLSGNPTIADLITRHGGPVEVLRFVHDHPDTAEIDEALVDKILRIATPTTVARILDTTQQHHIHVVTPAHEEWPGQVNDLGRAAPLALFIHGDLNPLGEEPVAVTGDTHPTDTCRHIVVDVATGLADHRIPVMTALQPGVDQLAHDAASALHGPTVIVSHDPRIGTRLKDVTVVSENPPGAPLALRAGRRARGLLAALAGKVLVGEAAVSSPALQTGIAGHALGRPVAVLAESDNQPLGGGSAYLRHQYGADLVHDVTGVQRLH